MKSKIKKSKWREGLSSTSIGRFGGYKKDYFIDEKGFLCWNATADTISLEYNKKFILGQLKLSRNFIVERSADWTTMKYLLKCEQNGKLKVRATVYQSLLSPAVLYDIEDNNFIWLQDRSYQFMVNAYPLKKGIMTTTSNYAYDMKTDGRLESPWILRFRNSAYQPDTPLLFVFQHQPIKIITINDDYKKFVFSGKAGRVMVMLPFGIKRLPKEEVYSWEKKFPSKLKNQCDFWARILQTYPIKCKEEFQIDKKSGMVKIRNKFGYITGKNDWNIPPSYIAPVSPIISHAKSYGYPVKFEEKLVNFKLPTRLGYYSAAYSNSLTYEIPRCSYIDKTILPVKVENDKRFNNLNKKLKEYINKPVFTFGGDDTYDPINIQDVLHNFRILGWATWSLEEKDRVKAIEKLSRGLKNMNMANYDREIELMTKQYFLKEKKVWGIINDVTYDYEWYNGMQLAGLWAYVYFSNNKKALDFVKKKWSIIEGMTNYYRIFNDWATATFWTDLAWQHLWMDGFHYGWQGLICLARLARLLGKKSTEEEVEYWVAKSTLTRWCTWFLQEYVAKHKETFFRHWIKDEKKVLNEFIVGGFIATKGMTLSNYYNRGNVISYLVPELFLLYYDYPEIIEKLRIGQYKLLPRDIPDWNHQINKPIKSLRRKTIQLRALTWSEFCNQAIAWHHFYFLDSMLFTRALIFREPWQKLKSYTNRLTGPVMEAYLVGTHPLVIFPVDIKFLGNKWDEKLKTLTIKWASTIKRNARIKVFLKQRPKMPSIIGLDKWNYDRKSGLLKGQWIAKGEGNIVIKL